MVSGLKFNSLIHSTFTLDTMKDHWRDFSRREVHTRDLGLNRLTLTAVLRMESTGACRSFFTALPDLLSASPCPRSLRLPWPPLPNGCMEKEVRENDREVWVFISPAVLPARPCFG